MRRLLTCVRAYAGDRAGNARSRVRARVAAVRHINTVNNAFADVTNDLVAQAEAEVAGIEAAYAIHGDAARRATEMDKALARLVSAHSRQRTARDGFLSSAT